MAKATERNDSTVHTDVARVAEIGRIERTAGCSTTARR